MTEAMVQQVLQDLQEVLVLLLVLEHQLQPQDQLV